MIIFWIFFALRATRCSWVWGLIPSFAPMTRIAASIIAAPESIVAISISCPGASTKVMYRQGFPFEFLSTVNFPLSSFTIASAYPSLIVIPRLSSSECVSAHLPDSLCRRVVFPWSMCPTMPTLIVCKFFMFSISVVKKVGLKELLNVLWEWVLL